MGVALKCCVLQRLQSGLDEFAKFIKGAQTMYLLGRLHGLGCETAGF